MGPIGCSETSARIYQSILHNIPAHYRPHLHSSRSLKSPKILLKQKKIKILNKQNVVESKTDYAVCLKNAVNFLVY